jgi:hypothetical protein
MRASLALLFLLAGCAPAVRAQQAPECTRDADCVIVEHDCCEPCCACPRVMSRAQDRVRQQRCAVIDCELPDCSHTRCEPCGIIRRAACVGGACVPR